VPQTSSSILTLNLQLTNPARSYEKFGDPMFVVIEVIEEEEEEEFD